MSESPLNTNKRDVIDYFDSVCSHWESLLTDRSIRIAKSVVERSAALIGSSVLDVGAGTGVLLRYLPQFASAYTGLEISLGMVNVFRTLHPHHRIVQGDIESDSVLRDELFDTIVIYNTFPLFRSPDSAIKNCRRLMRRGGAVVVAQDRTRRELAELHQMHAVSERGYVLPTDREIDQFCKAHQYQTSILDDSEYFYLVLVAGGREVSQAEGIAACSLWYLPMPINQDCRGPKRGRRE